MKMHATRQSALRTKRNPSAEARCRILGILGAVSTALILGPLVSLDGALAAEPGASPRAELWPKKWYSGRTKKPTKKNTLTKKKLKVPVTEGSAPTVTPGVKPLTGPNGPEIRGAEGSLGGYPPPDVFAPVPK